MAVDKTQSVVEASPSLAPDETWRFACHPEVTCFNACCHGLHLMLSPYDVLRLRGATGLSAKEFLSQHAELGVEPKANFPTVRLKMLDEDDEACPFVSEAGCTVYGDRPGACRIFPLGRGVGVDAQGNAAVQLIRVEDPVCEGFASEQAWTSVRWFADQGLGPYHDFDDTYAHVHGIWARARAKLSREQLQVAFMVLYRLDEVPTFIAERDLFEQMGVPESHQEAIAQDELARLKFGLVVLTQMFQDRGGLVSL